MRHSESRRILGFLTPFNLNRTVGLIAHGLDPFSARNVRVRAYPRFRVRRKRFEPKR